MPNCCPTVIHKQTTRTGSCDWCPHCRQQSSSLDSGISRPVTKVRTIINKHGKVVAATCRLDWIEQCFTAPPTQYRLYGRRFLQVKKTQPTVSNYWRNIQYTDNAKIYNNLTYKHKTANPLVYTNMGWLGDGSHRGQVRHAWTAGGLPWSTPPRQQSQTESVCDLSSGYFLVQLLVM